MGRLARLLALVVLLLPSLAWADSPLTSVEFWKAYTDVPAVVKAHESGKLEPDQVAFLLSSAPVDQRAALISALPFRGGDEEVLRAALARKYGCDPKKVDSRLCPEEACCLGYLMGRQNFYAASLAKPLLKRARSGLPTSFTVAIVETLLYAQDAMLYGGGSSKVWPLVAKTLADKKLKNDLRPEARASIMEYLNLYREEHRH